ncbi:MAG: hypothetical protein SLRJCFUN_000887 [Candidatus Fervidibacter sp.]|jgi:hypothetical protein
MVATRSLATVWRPYLAMLDEQSLVGIGPLCQPQESEAVGVTKEGKGSKVMLVTDGQWC